MKKLSEREKRWSIHKVIDDGTKSIILCTGKAYNERLRIDHNDEMVTCELCRKKLMRAK
jgi:hypothetical protein